MANIFNNQSEVIEATIEAIETRNTNPTQGPFGENSIIWEVFGERSAAIALPRMGILQLAHPEIIRAITKYSTFPTEPKDRLNATATFLNGFVYGDLKTVKKMSRALLEIHRKALRNMEVSEDKMTELYNWVHFTTWESFIIGYEATVRRLTQDEKKQLYAELKLFAGLLGIHDRFLPKTFNDFKLYMTHKETQLEFTEEVTEFWSTLMQNQQAWDRVIPASSHLVSRYGKKVLFKISNSLLPERVQQELFAPSPVEATLVKGALLLLKRMVKFLPKELRYKKAYLQAKIGVNESSNTALNESSTTTKVQKCPFARFFSKAKK